MSLHEKSFEVASELKEQMINLIDDLLEILPNETDIFLVRIYFDTAINPIELMDNFIEYVLPWRDYIEQRDETYFEKNDHIFGKLPKNKVQHFKNLYTNDVFDASQKEIIWQYFDVFLSLADTYKKYI